MGLLETVIVGNIFAFILVFSRIGSAIMIMPGIGDSFVSPEIRLLFALALSFVVMPALAPSLPPPPADVFGYVLLVGSETLLGIFIGTVMRVLMAALDTAGMVISMQAGFANVMVLNPAAGSQGSIAGALYAMAGTLLIMVTDLHHMLLASVFDSYALFPASGILPDAGSMLDVVARAVDLAFKTGFSMAIPFIVVGVLLQIGFGILGRLMPQVQIFFLALPAQVLIGLVTLAMTFSAGILLWLNQTENAMAGFLPGVQ